MNVPLRRPIVAAAAASSLALMGDSLLYAVLAAEAPDLGIPLVSVGMLLSVNRFVRFATNPWAASVFHRYGREWPFFAAMVAAALTTFAYGLPGGLWTLLPARVVWGACWSFLNLGMYLAVLEHAGADERTRWMGMLKAISRLGTIAAVTIGAYLTDAVGFRPVTVALGFMALAGAGVAFWDAKRSAPPRGFRRTQQDRAAPGTPAGPDQGQTPRHGRSGAWLLYLIGFVYGFIISGIVVGTISLLVVQRYGAAVAFSGLTLGAATFSGLLLGARWVIEIVVGPLGGSVGDRLGPERVLLSAVGVLSVALAALPFVHNAAGLMLLSLAVFVSGVTFSVCLDALVGRLAMEQGAVNRVMSRYVTALDMGSAVGPLVGYLIGLGVGLEGVYVAASLLCAAAAAAFARSAVFRKAAAERPARSAGGGV